MVRREGNRRFGRRSERRGNYKVNSSINPLPRDRLIHSVYVYACVCVCVRSHVRARRGLSKDFSTTVFSCSLVRCDDASETRRSGLPLTHRSLRTSASDTPWKQTAVGLDENFNLIKIDSLLRPTSNREIRILS